MRFLMRKNGRMTSNVLNPLVNSILVSLTDRTSPSIMNASIEEKKRVAAARAQNMIRHVPKKPETAQKEGEGADEQYDTKDRPKENELIHQSSFGMRPLYSKVDINCEKWLLTMDEASRKKLENPPSLADGLDKETEADLRYLGCELIQQGAILLALPQTAAATGQILFQRFYYQRSFVKFMFEHTVMACLLLASKIEEAPRRPREVYNVFHRLEQLHRLRNAGRPITKETTARLKPHALDISYVNTKNSMIKAERRILATLGFVVHVKHPHKLICSYIHGLRCTERRDLIQKAWSYMNDGLRTDMFLRYTPETIACACIFLAARTVEPPIALPSTPFHWFELFDASDRDVQAIALMLQTLYSRKKCPNWDKLTAALTKIQTEKEAADKALKAKLVADKISAESKANGNGRDSRESSERENRDSRRRSRSRSRSPRKNSKYSPKRRRDSPNGRYRGRGGGYRDEGRGDKRDRKDDRGDRRDDRRRSRDRSDRDKEREQRSKVREREIRRFRKELSPPPLTKRR